MSTITQRVVRRARAHGLTVLTHGQWGSRQRATYAKRRVWTRLGVYGRFRREADTLVQHITVTVDTGPLTGDFKVDCRTVERIGYERFKSGMSYNFLVDMRSGMAAVGQPLDSKGTHTVNDKGVDGFSHDQNLVGRAIAFLGMPGDKVSDAAAETAAVLIASMIEEGALTGTVDYLPHSFFAWKDCPTEAARDRMPEIRRRAMRIVGVRDNRPARKQRRRTLVEERARSVARDAA